MGTTLTYMGLGIASPLPCTMPDRFFHSRGCPSTSAHPRLRGACSWELSLGWLRWCLRWSHRVGCTCRVALEASHPDPGHLRLCGPKRNLGPTQETAAKGLKNKRNVLLTGKISTIHFTKVISGKLIRPGRVQQSSAYALVSGEQWHTEQSFKKEFAAILSSDSPRNFE